MQAPAIMIFLPHLDKSNIVNHFLSFRRGEIPLQSKQYCHFVFLFLSTNTWCETNSEFRPVEETADQFKLVIGSAIALILNIHFSQHIQTAGIINAICSSLQRLNGKKKQSLLLH